jgi:FkbM family methyltransferase
MHKIIKKIIYRVLVNRFTGNIICSIYPRLIPDIRWSRYKFGIKREGVDKSLAAAIFWGFYEAAEIRFIHKYYSGKTDVIELGGSMGIVTSHLASIMEDNRKLIAVEANPFLAETLEANVNRYIKRHSHFTLLNMAIAYHSSEVALHITGNSTETKAVQVVKVGENDKIIVKAIKLSEIIDQFALKMFTLVCDIEGSEIELLKYENEGLEKCVEMFIELHETTFESDVVSTEKLKEIIESVHKFKLVDRNGPVLYFKRF